jgi:hypothetical protein
MPKPRTEDWPQENAKNAKSLKLPRFFAFFALSRGQSQVLPSPRRSLVVPSVIVASLLALGTVVLFCFDPAENSFYPVCAFHRATGLLCPGCGSLRAVHQLLRGHLEAAFRYNALLVSALPFAGWLALRFGLAKARRQPRLPELRPVWLWTALVVVVLFGILRNLPFAQAAWLAP